MQFARRFRWLLALTLLLTALTIQLILPADGASERGEQRSSIKELGVVDYEGGTGDDADQVVEDVDEMQLTETVSSRPRKRAWQHYARRSAVALPLIVVGLAAAYAAAGYVMRLRRRRAPVATPVETPAIETPVNVVETPAPAVAQQPEKPPQRENGRQKIEDVGTENQGTQTQGAENQGVAEQEVDKLVAAGALERGVQSLIKNGKHVLPAATALGIATAVAQMVVSRYGQTTPSQ